MINPISLNHLEIAFNIFKAVKKDMIAHGIDQWDDVYPNIEIIEADIKAKQAYGYFENEQLAGYIALNEHFDLEYNDLNWQFPDDRPLIVHRLAVNPKCQGLGIAKALMQFAEKMAKENGYATIRLDAFSGNVKALQFYDKLGYLFVGYVTFRKGLFHCFEKRFR